MVISLFKFTGSFEAMEKDIDTAVIRFPWRHENVGHGNRNEDFGKKPGEYILGTLFLEFCGLAEKKIEQVLGEALVCIKIKRGEFFSCCTAVIFGGVKFHDLLFEKGY